MSEFAAFLTTLLREGRAVLGERPQSPAGSDAEAIRVLEAAFESYRLEVAGQLIEFDVKSALAAADVVWEACWFLVTRRQTEEEVESALMALGNPDTPAAHLSADLVLRYLPAVHRRAYAHDPAERLTMVLETILRTWPLTGVLSDVQDGPLQSIEFGGHHGLLMFYAERLAANEKPGWFPAGMGREYVRLVWQERGKDLLSMPSLPMKSRSEAED
jgi:MoxR-vWA-beta-propeller ternary system protein